MATAGALHSPLYPIGYLVGALFLLWCAVALWRGRFYVRVLIRSKIVTRQERPLLYWSTIGGYLVIGFGLLSYPLIDWMIA